MPATDEAIVLAGGLGTRLRGVIDDLPKPLAPVAGRPFVAWLLDALAAQGVRRVILATGYRAEQIEAALGMQWQHMDLAYSRESRPLGTGGAMALAAQMLDGDAAFVLNGDTALHLDYDRFAEFTCGANARLGLALSQVPDVARYGAVTFHAGRVAGFLEKGASGTGYVNAGVYWMERSLLSSLPAATAFSFEADVLVPAVARECVAAFTETSGFIDIGVPDDYARAQALFSTFDIAP